MAWYNNILSGKPKTVVNELVEAHSMPDDADVINQKTLELITDPVDYKTLEKLYRRDSDTFAAINHIVKTFMSSNYTVVSDNKGTQEWINAFLKQTRFDIIIRKIVQHCCIYGNAWVELVMNSKGNIVAFDHIDPKMMDFSRDSSGHILYDKYNNPQYYVQMLSSGTKAPDNKNSRLVSQNSPQILDTSGQGIKFFPNEVAHFTLWTVGDQLSGVGLIEPMWNALMAKIQIEKDWGIAMKKSTSPLLVGRVGDELHKATPKAITSMTDMLANSTSRSVLALPYPDDVKYVAANIPSLEPHLSYYVDKVSAATGVPKPYIVGSGDQTPRSTFKGLNLGYERNIMEMQKSIAYAVEKEIFPILTEQYGLKGSMQMVFEPPSIEYMDSKATRMVDYSNAGLLIPDFEVRQIIRRMENLPPEDPKAQAEQMAMVKKAKGVPNPKNEENIDASKEA